MSFLSYLPAEVITRFLSFLSPKQLASCTQLSKHIFTIIKTSSVLTYALELGKAGLDDTYHLDFGRFEKGTSELLAALRKREHAWSTFTWNKQWDVPVEKVYNTLEVCGPVFIGAYTRQRRGIDTIDVYDFHDVTTNGLVTTLFLDAPCYGYAIDAGQDLLVLIERYTNERHLSATSPRYKLHLRKLSTGLEYDHTEIAQPTLSLKIFSTGSWRTNRSKIQIFGDNLLVEVRLDKSSDVRLINWKTTQYHTLYSGVSDTFRWTMISETEILLIGYGEDGPLLKYYTVKGFGPNSPKLEEIDPLHEANESYANTFEVLDQVIFGLPFRNARNPVLPRTWDIGLISSEASFTPKSFSPFVKPTTFVYSPKLQIIGIKFQNAEATLTIVDANNPESREGVSFDMFIHLESLRKLKDEVSLSSSPAFSQRSDTIPSIAPVPWPAWGPSITRVLDDNYDGNWNRRCIHGYRVLVTPEAPEPEDEELENQPVGYTILDFNVRPSIGDQCTLMTCDGIMITSSLPFRIIDIPFSRNGHHDVSNGFGIEVTSPNLLLGDDIICRIKNTCTEPGCFICMNSLSTLPIEVITRILSFLLPKELASCTCLSKQFLAIIKASSTLTYALEVGKAGLDETYHLKFDRFDKSPSDLLAALRERENAWSTLTWKKQWDIPVDKGYTRLKVCGPVFTGAYARDNGGRGVDTIEVYDFHDIKTNGLVTILYLDRKYYDYVMDAGQDLLILIEECGSARLCYKLLFRTLSAGLEYDHTELSNSIILVQVPILNLLDLHYSPPMVQIFGDNLLYVRRADQTSDVRVINWKTSQCLLICPEFDVHLSKMISETEFFLIGYANKDTPLLKYYTLNENCPHTFEVLNHVLFYFPFRTFPDILSISRSPEASFCPKSFSPFVRPSTFVYPPKSQLVGIKFHLDLTFDLFIHIESLRKLKDRLSSTPLNSIIEVPWQEWGPSITRIIEDSSPYSEWNERYIRGYRVLTPKQPNKPVPGGPSDYTIMDFNINPSGPHPSELMTIDGTEFVSSLPYREIGSSPNGLGKDEKSRYFLLGDDIIYLDNVGEDLPQRLHVFQF